MPPRRTALGWLRGWPAQLADPLTRNGYALVANSAATGGLGLIYWLLMARLYPASSVGRASAAYTAMNLLAGFTALNFNGALTRFIPQSGRGTRSLVLRAYAVSAAASVGITIPFVLTISRWGQAYTELGGLTAGAVFVCCVVAWALFTLQDSVLTGLRSAGWVLAENGAFGVAKILLLIALVSALPGHLGIYVSWMLPVLVAVPLVNSLIFGRLIPRHSWQTRDAPPPSTRQIGRFLAGDYAGSAFQLATVNLVPLLVSLQLAVRSNAYFYMAWMIGSIVDLVGINMAMSLTVEGSFRAAALASDTRRALRKMAILILPAAALTGLLAPWGLGLFGPSYAAQGTPVLRLLAIATLPRALTELYLGVLRAQSRTTRVAVIQGARSLLVLALVVPLTGAMGMTGGAVAALAGQLAPALVTAPALWRVLAGARPGAAVPVLEPTAP